MTASVVDLDVEGAAAPPRSNGELVFAEPWQARVFGLTMALVDRGAVSYDEFRERLIARIRSWEQAHPGGGEFSYYRCWLAALEQELADRQIVGAGDLAARSAALVSRPAGHDHGHEHEHGHEPDQGHGHGHL